MNVETKTTILWSGSRHTAARQFYKHCTKTENGCPGVICIICHTVLVHPSENRTSTMAKHLQSKTPKVELNKLTESNVSLLTGTAGDEQALAVLKKKGSQGVMVASSFHQIQAD